MVFIRTNAERRKHIYVPGWVTFVVGEYYKIVTIPYLVYKRDVALAKCQKS